MHHGSNLPERFLHHLWADQLVEPSLLDTFDGRRVEVVNPGRLNHDGGPDFTGAQLRVGGISFVGDVELHRIPSDWVRHGHQFDPAYNRVILHVVFDDHPVPFATLVASGRQVPLLVLRNRLARPIQELWHHLLEQERRPTFGAIPCFSLNRSLDAKILESWMSELGYQRLEMKVQRFQERRNDLASTDFRERSSEFWNQLIYEGLLEALGYSKNRLPFLRLARNVPLAEFHRLGIADNLDAIHACLLGASGLIDLDAESILAVQARRRFAVLWETLRPRFLAELLQPGDWQRFPLRPGNSPQLRISAAAGIAFKLLNEALFQKIMEAIQQDLSDSLKVEQLCELLQLRPFTALPTLGQSRMLDMIVNVIIPIAQLYGRSIGDDSVLDRSLQLYRHVPRLQSNSVTQKMEAELVRGRVPMSTALLQQGCIHLYNFFCRDVRCGACTIGRSLFERP